MTRTITAHFDGKVFVPDEPVELPIGKPLSLRVEIDEIQTPRFQELTRFGTDVPDAPNDLAAQHDHHLYGTPKQ